MDMIKVAVIGTIGSLLALALKSAKGEFATYINLSACVLIMLYLAARLSGIVSQLEFMTEYVDIDSDYILIMLKMAGLTYIAEFCSSICKDAGYQTISVQIEIFSKLTILVLGIPVLLTLLETIQEFLS